MTSLVLIYATAAASFTFLHYNGGIRSEMLPSTDTWRSCNGNCNDKGFFKSKNNVSFEIFRKKLRLGCLTIFGNCYGPIDWNSIWRGEKYERRYSATIDEILICKGCKSLEFSNNFWSQHLERSRNIFSQRFGLFSNTLNVTQTIFFEIKKPQLCRARSCESIWTFPHFNL